MYYNLHLLWRMTLRSFWKTSGTHGQLKRKRVVFLVIFFTVWPLYTLITRLFFLLDDVLFPGYRKQKVEKPLFLIGNFRSGSTFLHRTLSRDTAIFTSMRTWDIYITPTITQRKIMAFLGRIDTVLGGHVRRLLVRLDDRSLGKVRIHQISMLKPEEDENVLLHAWATLFVCFLFPFLDELPPYYYFDEQVPEKDRDRIMRFYRSCVQRHLYATGKPHFVAKNPAQSVKIASLVRYFPDARIVYLARNPLEMLPSTISWLSYAWNTFSVPLEPHPFRSHILQFTRYWYRYPLAYMDAHPSPNHLVVKYDDLVANPAGVILDLYQRFGYGQTGRIKEIALDAERETLNYKTEHVYSYEQMGFTREQIVTLYADIFQRFNFETDI